MLRNVYLYGDLAKKYGEVFTFDVDSFADCARALACAFEDFQETISPNEYALVCDQENIGANKVALNFGQGDFHIIPKIHGAGVLSRIRNVGIAEFVIGAILFTASFFVGGPVASAVLFNTGIAFMVGGAVTFLMSFLLPETEVEASRKSFIFSNLSNSTKQGGPVPLCYGEYLVGSVVVSGSLDVEDLSDDYSVKHSAS